MFKKSLSKQRSTLGVHVTHEDAGVDLVIAAGRSLGQGEHPECGRGPAR